MHLGNFPLTHLVHQAYFCTVPAGMVTEPSLTAATTKMMFTFLYDWNRTIELQYTSNNLTSWTWVVDFREVYIDTSFSSLPSLPLCPRRHVCACVFVFIHTPTIHVSLVLPSWFTILTNIATVSMLTILQATYFSWNISYRLSTPVQKPVRCLLLG